MISVKDVYNEKVQMFEDKINFQIDDIIKSIQLTANSLNTYHKEK